MLSKILILSKYDTTGGPMAAAFLTQQLQALQDTEHAVQSAGIMARPSDSIGIGARQALAEAGIPLAHIGATPLIFKEIQTSDLIVCLSQEVRSLLKSRFHFDGPKAILLMPLAGSDKDVLEAKSASPEANRRCLEQMKPALTILAQRLAGK